MNLLVDPVLLTLPEPASDVEACLCFVEQLSAWSQEIRAQRYEFFISEACVIALYESGRYPQIHTLLPLWETAGVYEVDCRTAYLACHRVLTNLPYFEDRVSVRGQLVHLGKVQVAPDLVGRLQEPVAAALRETLGYVAYAREESQHPIATDLILVTHPIQDGTDAQIEAVVETSEGEKMLTTDLPLVETPEDLLELEGLEGLWEDTDRALRWAVSDLIRKRCLDEGARLAPYAVAPEFNQSIRDNHFDGRPDRLAQIFLKVALLLAGYFPRKETREHHRLRTLGKPLRMQRGSTGKSWEAWRLWITRGKLGMRLHYWWRDGQYVLSKVGPHDDYSIGGIR